MQPTNVSLQFFCPRWGQEHETYDAFCRKVKEAGYDGIEAPVSFDAKEREEQANALVKYNLLLIGQYYQSFEKDFAEHKSNYEKHLISLLQAKPVKIDSQTGKDYFSFEQNKELFDLAKKLSEEYNIPIAHETHRNKALFAAHTSKLILERLPGLPVTADFSHWCAVAETLLEDQEEATALACKHAIHIHARIGYEEGPQVNDPRAPEWQNALNTHLQWWDAIIANHQNTGAGAITITPEFGPWPYIPSVPYTKQPLSSQWDINVYMMQLLKKRYQ